MDKIQDALKKRFPLLTALRILHSSGETEELAAFMGVLLAAIAGAENSPFCFIFPRKAAIAPMSAALYALGRFAFDFPSLAEQYAKRNFAPDQSVKLIPGDRVFRFAGVWPGLDTFFRLKLVNDKRNTCFSFPVTEILRIEPTDRKIPKGREEDIHLSRRDAPPSSLDKLIGTMTFGNNSLAVNHVLYLGGRAEVEEFLANTILTGTSVETRATIGGLVTPGSIDEDGKVRPFDSYQTQGEPLVAISARLENVAAACSLAIPGSKVVVVDGARRITDLAKFDLIAESQNLIIVAEPDEEEKLQQLHNRGCRFWRFSLADLEMGNDKPTNGRFFSGIFRAAKNAAMFRTRTAPCRNLHLEDAAHALQACQSALDESEADQTQLILRQIYGLLVRCTGLLSPPDHNEHIELIEATRKIEAAAGDRFMWLSDAVKKPLERAISSIRKAVDDPELGESKGKALKALLGETSSGGTTAIALLARSPYNKIVLSRWLEREGLDYSVVLPAKVGEDGFFERLITTSWPGASIFGRVVKKSAAPEICLVSYPFESQWLYWFNRKERNGHFVPSLNTAERSALLGLNGEASWPTGTEIADASVAPEPSQELPQIDFEERMIRKGAIVAGATGEDRLPARMVSFLGDAYAFITDTAKIPVLTDLVSGKVAVNSKVPRRRLADITLGDVLVFRERGRRDVIHALADAQLGPDAPKIRERAARWHRALRESGMDEIRLVAELHAVKCPRTINTVRTWLADDSTIGPQTKDDLVGIGYAIGDQSLIDDVEVIWDAIETLQGEHLSAGMRLSRILLEKLPDRLHQIQEGRTRIEIDNTTSAWIVQVDAISDKVEMTPRSYTNDLLWDPEDFLF